MYRILTYLSLVLAGLGAVSCEIYSDEESLVEPGYMVVQRTYRDYIYNIFNVAELSGFFQQYQSIRSDRDAAVKLAEDYFHQSAYWDGCLFFEQAEISGWGKIVLEDDGSFSVIVRTTYMYTPERTFSVIPNADGRFVVEYEAKDSDSDLQSLQAAFICDDDWVTLEECKVVCTFPDSGYCTISSVEDEPVRKAIVSRSYRTYTPVSGRLLYEYSDDNGGEDRFETGFSEDCQTVERGQSVVKCKPLAFNQNLTVDYVID